MAAVSPAVVVPGLLDLQKRKYGVEKGIPTMVIAAASIDDVLAISGFGISLGLAFSEGQSRSCIRSLYRKKPLSKHLLFHKYYSGTL